MNSGPLAVLHCRELVTLRGPGRARRGPELCDLGVIRDGGLVVVDGRIVAVGPTDDIRSTVPASATIIEARHRVVLPGFVDAHTHLVFAGSRIDEYERRARGESYETISAAGGGIMNTVRATRLASEDALLARARRHLGWCLATGTTSFEIKSGYGLTQEDEIKMLRVISRLRAETGLKLAATCLAAHTVPPEFAGRADAYIDHALTSILPQVAKEKLADYADIFCDPIAFAPAQARRYLTGARALGFGLRAHVDQLADTGGAGLAAEAGAVTADHLEHTAATGIAALAAARVQPVLLPGSVYALGRQRYPAARAMIEAGLAVVLATDFNPGSSPVPSMLAVLSLAVTQMKLTPAEAISAATINAAASLGWSGDLGSIEVGKRANFVLHDIDDYREVTYWVGHETADTVVADGRVVFQRNSPS